MKKKRSLRTFGIAASVLAAAVFTAALLSAPGKGFEKVRPFTLELCPTSDLVKNCAAKVEGDNVKLAQFLTDLRAAVAGHNKKYEAVPREGRPAFKPMEWWDGYSKPANPFAGTYLQKPRLTTEEGTTLTVWEEILAKLVKVIGDSTYIDVQSVHVCLEYLPYGGEKFKAYNPSGDGIDFVAHVKTVLAYAPEDDPITMDGELRHRKTCIYEPEGR